MNWAEIAWIGVGATFGMSIILRYIVKAVEAGWACTDGWYAKEQINELAKVIMEEIPGEPSENEGAAETAIRVMREYKMHLQELQVLRPDECLMEDGLIQRVSPGTSHMARSGSWTRTDTQTPTDN